MRPIAFDLTRMFVGASGSTPRGIDRVDMGYATRILADPRAVGLVPSPARMGVLSGREAARLAARVARGWREEEPASADSALERVQARLGDAPADAAIRRPDAGIARAPRYAGMLLDAARSPWRAAARAVPHGALYVNVGQILMGWPWFFGWLDRRPDVRPVFLVHDAIPLLFPEYTGPAMARHHAAVMAVVARHAAALIGTSHAATREIAAAAARHGRRDIPTVVVPLPVPGSLLPADAPPAGRPAAPYFVAVGNMDQRKNHLLLLQVWRALRERPGPPPRLVLVGSRGLRVGGLVEVLERSPGLADHVVEARDLSTPAMRELIRGARAALMPSFTEGFGLPIIEALALGTPVIASDIPVHREVGGALCTYLDPIDGAGWMREITLRADEGADALRARRASLAGYRPQTWDRYFDEVMPFLRSL